MSTSPQPRRLQRRTTVNVMLYVGVLAMAMLTYYDYRERNQPPAELQLLPAEDVSTVGIHRPGHRTIDVQRESDGSWNIVSPIARIAQPSRIDALLAITTLAADDAYDAGELNLGELGLGTPLATVNLSDGKATTHVQLGGLGPNNQRRYVRTNHWVWLADDVFLPLIEGGLRAFADAIIVPTERTLESIGGIDATTIDNWQDSAAGILPLDEIEDANRRVLTLSFGDGSREDWHYQQLESEGALIPPQANYALLITNTQAEQLGLSR